MSNFGRFETKEEEAPEKQLRLNKQVEPKQHGDTDEPETPMSDPGESPSQHRVSIDIQNVEANSPAPIRMLMQKRDSNSRLAAKRGMQISELGFKDERLQTSPKERELKINL